MPRDIEAMAAEVALLIKSAMAPVLERLAVSEQCNRDLTARVQELTALRDRVTTVEAKAAPGMSPADLELTLRDRIDPVTARLASVEQTQRDAQELATKCAALAERLMALETKPAPVPPLSEPPTIPTAAIELSIRDRIEPLTKRVATLSERIAVLEVKAPIPGPAGKDGVPGTNGKDGVDGFGFDELSVAQTNERQFVVKGTRGDRVKELGSLTFPVEIYRGVYIEGRAYEPGDCTTWAGSEWHCNEPTTNKPGDGLKAWTLKVKRGRDGKDGRDAVTTPVVSIGRS